MQKIVIDAAMRAKLKNLNEQVEFCDESGSTLGRFVPAELYERMLYDIAKTQVSEEELQRRLNEPGGSTLAEIWEELERR